MTSRSSMRLSRITPLLLTYGAFVAGRSALAQQHVAFTPSADYEQTIFVTPNGFAHYAGPMIGRMLGAGHATHQGGGHRAKVGLTAGLEYAKQTEGVIDTDDYAPDCNGDDMRYYVTKGDISRGLPLPPNVLSLDALPPIVANNLPDWATTSRCPPVIATLEWARYYKMPVTFQMLSIVSHAGINPNGNLGRDLDWYFESKGKSRCMWDVSDVCDPNDDNPATFENVGASFGPFSFATPTLLDPDYRCHVKRNAKDAVTQLLAICSDPRYQGMIAGLAIDPEIHLPAHYIQSYPLAQHPAYFPPGTPTPYPEVNRPFLEDYNPLVIAAFQQYEQKRYWPDVAPNVDTNGDGITFVADTISGTPGDFTGDYATSGWPGVHDHPAPTAWNQIDPPRKYPRAKYNALDQTTHRSKYWHEWTNFRVQYVDDFIEELVDAVVTAGWPADRVFTHQTGGSSSFTFDRAHGTPDTDSHLYNAEWLDDWTHVEVSRGMAGTSHYSPSGITSGRYVFENLVRRDDSWGAPEFNPFHTGTPTPPSYTAVETAVNEAWNTRAHILWPHTWGGLDEPVFDMTTAWARDRDTGSGTYLRFTGWTSVNFDVLDALAPRIRAATNDAYLEKTGLSLDANLYPYAVLKENWHVPNSSAFQADLKVQLQYSGVWQTPILAAGVLRNETASVREFVVDLWSGGTAWSTSTITGMRVWPAPVAGSLVELDSLVLAKANHLTTALHGLMSAKQNIDRPAKPPIHLLNPTAATDLSQSIAVLNNSGNFAVYGTDPIGVLSTNPTGSGEFSDFAPTNAVGRINFDHLGSITCGGSSREGISADAPIYLGMRKTGKFRRIHLPDADDLCLSFYIGLRDGAPSTTDGARFRVVLRDSSRNLVTLFDREWRKHAWSARHVLPLASWKNQTVDIAFETHGIGDATGDRAAWGEPTIERGAFFGSIGPDDGRVIATAEGMNVGSDPVFALDLSGTALRVGDTTDDKQIKSILSFDTSPIPDGATVTGVSLRLVCGGVAGSVSANGGLGALVVDIEQDLFHFNGYLEKQDFQASATAPDVGTFVLPTMSASSAPVPDAAFATATLNGDGCASINKAGKTQFRIRFVAGDNDNLAADYLGFFSGEPAVAAGLRPVLEVTYTP